MEAEPVEQVDDMGCEADAHTHVGAGVFQNQIPADDPCDEFAERGVGVGVSRAGNGDHGGQLGVAKSGERTDNGHHNHGNRDGGTCAWTACERSVRNEKTGQRRVDHAGGVKLLAGDGGADDCEDARADDRRFCAGLAAGVGRAVLCRARSPSCTILAISAAETQPSARAGS